jgi:YfiR/HmsC-like
MASIPLLLLRELASPGERKLFPPARSIASPCRSRMLLLSSSLVLSVAASLAAQQSTPSEYQDKAAFLYNFAKFVEWPHGTFAKPSSAFRFCVFGKDPFGKVLDDALLGKQIAEHPVELTRARRISDLAGCQVVFIPSSENSHLSEAVASLRGRNVLLVGEGEEFADSGGAIQFFLQDNRVRFAINPDAASRAGLKVSSKLLALASVIRDSATEGKN